MNPLQQHRPAPSTRSLTASALLCLLLAAVFPTGSLAQGWIVDQQNRPAPLALAGSDVSAQINHQVASVSVTTTFQNPGRATVEGTYLFPLPDGASVSSFNLSIDGKPVAGELLASTEARRTYEAIVRNALDPALLEWAGGGLFKARVFPIAPGESREISLRYDLVLPRSGDVVRFVHPTTGELRSSAVARPRLFPSGRDGAARSGRKGDPESRIQISITSDADVRNLYSPTHELDVERTVGRTNVVATRILDARARSLVVYYSLTRDHLAATFIAHRPYTRKSGYFMLMLDPPVHRSEQKIQPRDVVFVLDTSGSMAGDKIRQAKDAVSYALRRLGPDDRFGIVAFNSDVNPFADRLSRTSDTDDALYFVDQLEARGGTNINEALATGLGFLDDKRKGMVVFLTDGLPSTGVVNINEIRTNAERNNRFHARIFSFGVGYDVNTNLLDGLSRSSAAFADYIVPEENIEERVSAFYERVRFPVMTDVEISFRGVRVSEISPRDPGDLFLGDALILTGRYRNEGTGVISISGSIDGQRTTQEVDVAFPAVDRESAFVARVWATRRIGELLESVRLEGESEALVDEIVELAKEFGIVTPYTSYLVTEDEARFLSAGEFDRVSADNNAMPRAQREALAAMPQSSGRAAIEMSKRISNFKQASVVESTDGIPVTNVLGQTLIESAGGIWESQADVAGLKVWRVKFGSEAYFDFAESYPEAKDFLKLGEKVNFVFRNQVVVVGESGQSEIDREGLTRLFGE